VRFEPLPDGDKAPELNLAACRTFLASAPEVVLAIITHSRIDFEGYGSTFESALCQKAVRPCGLRVATASALRPQRKSHGLRAAPCIHRDEIEATGRAELYAALAVFAVDPQRRLQVGDPDSPLERRVVLMLLHRKGAKPKRRLQVGDPDSPLERRVLLMLLHRKCAKPKPRLQVGDPDTSPRPSGGSDFETSRPRALPQCH